MKCLAQDVELGFLCRFERYEKKSLVRWMADEGEESFNSPSPLRRHALSPCVRRKGSKASSFGDANWSLFKKNPKGI